VDSYPYTTYGGSETAVKVMSFIIVSLHALLLLRSLVGTWISQHCPEEQLAPSSHWTIGAPSVPEEALPSPRGSWCRTLRALVHPARNHHAAAAVAITGMLTALCKYWMFSLMENTSGGVDCDSDCLMGSAILQAAMYMPFPVIVYTALRMDTNWWANIEVDIELAMMKKRESCIEDEYRPLQDGQIEVEMGLELSSVLSGQVDKVPRLVWNEVFTSKKIGEGATATVYLGTYRGTACAVKKIMCEDLTKESLHVMMQEVGLTWKLQHPSTVRFYGFFISLPEVCLVYELCERGTLTDLLAQVRDGTAPLDMPGPAHFAVSAARSVALLHTYEPRVVHRDIKASNYLVSEDWSVKLADFGEARLCAAQGLPMSLVGSPGYMAPEIMRGKHGQAQYDHRVDVYSLSMVLWQLLTAERPFENEGLRVWDMEDAVLSGRRPKIPDCDAELKALIEKAWADDPSERPSAVAMVGVLERLAKEQKQAGGDAARWLGYGNNSSALSRNPVSDPDAVANI